MKNDEKLTGAVIDYIEGHLSEKLDLERVAKAVHYSKYHLHRAFTQTAGRTIHDYVQRRQLTEAAKLLVYSDRPILEIALSAGYESQQAFTTVFREMYKKIAWAVPGGENFLSPAAGLGVEEYSWKAGWRRRLAEPYPAGQNGGYSPMDGACKTGGGRFSLPG